MVPGTTVAPFPYLMWEVVLHCLRSYFSNLYARTTIDTHLRHLLCKAGLPHIELDKLDSKQDFLCDMKGV
jgi:hypothetical protein